MSEDSESIEQGWMLELLRRTSMFGREASVLEDGNSDKLKTLRAFRSEHIETSMFPDFKDAFRGNGKALGDMNDWEHPFTFEFDVFVGCRYDVGCDSHELTRHGGFSCKDCRDATRSIASSIGRSDQICMRHVSGRQKEAKA